jgi:precorrin-6B methylase 2
MTARKFVAPETDPTPVCDFFRGSYGTELLTAAVAHFNLFGLLGERALSFDELRGEVGLERRPANVLFTTLRALGLLEAGADGKLRASPLARNQFTPGKPLDMSGYIGLAAKSPGVIEMVARLKSNRPAHAEDKEQGAAYIYKEGVESAMEKEASARFLSLALAGRAMNCATAFAENVPWPETGRLLDIGGGTGIYSIAVLCARPKMEAIVWDRPEVLKVADEFARDYGVRDRVELRPGDMFGDDIPRDADMILLSNILHDWDEPDCAKLIQRCADALPANGSLLIHDVFLNDALDGPLPLSLYSAALFTLTEGRAYSAAEYRAWLRAAGMNPCDTIIPTHVNCGVIPSVRAGVGH